MDNDVLIKEFLLESFENLSIINEQLTKLEKDPENDELLNAIYRTVHTIKGSAGFLGYSILQDLTHVTENLLDELRNKNLSLTPKITDTLLGSFDMCHEIIKYIEEHSQEGSFDISVLKTKLWPFLVLGSLTSFLLLSISKLTLLYS